MTKDKDLCSAKVAIITRTKDRGIMLKRAGESVAKQTFKDFVWVVVNDGGDPDVVNNILADFSTVVDKIRVVHHAVNKGMEAASNAGIEGVQAEYVVIHDDDDSWHPDFLLETVSFLESERGQLFGGVITQSVHVEEKIVEEQIVHLFDKEWRPLLGYYPKGAVHLSDVATINQFPPIAFVFRKSAFDNVGAYDASLPVLGDWDFNIRFLSKFDIAVIDKPLANYHHRPSITAQNSHYGNSVHAGFDRHSTYEAIVRNNAIRAAMNGNNPTLGQLLFAGRQTFVDRMISASANRMADAVWRRLKRLLGR